MFLSKLKRGVAKANSRKEVNRFLFTVLVFFGLWLILTLSLSPGELFVGLVVSIIIGYIIFDRFIVEGFSNLTPKRIWYFLLYIPFFFLEVIKSNLDVAYRVLHPKMPIKPGIVIIKTTLKKDISKLILANSITLTPGTFTLDVVDDNYLIHWIYVEDGDVDKASRIIAHKFEKYIKEFAE